jgi:glycosyltransferase involved in cell wall biosynthesis
VRIAVCHPQVPFSTGGAEGHVHALTDALRLAGHDAEAVTLPYKWYPPEELVHQMAMWRSLDLSEITGRAIDAVVALKFPSYLVPHQHKVVWLMQQYQPAYELWEHPQFGELARDERGDEIRRMIWHADALALGEAKRLFTTSSNVRSRLQRSLGLEADVLYHRSTLAGWLLTGEPGGYGGSVLLPSRFEQRKRQGLLIDALARTRTDVRVVLVGSGPDEAGLRRRAGAAGVEDRVEFLSNVPNDRLVQLYRGALGVCYIPFDEDYGYVTLEGFAARRPVITATDSGGPLEFVRDGETGLVVEPDPDSVAEALDRLRSEPGLAERLGGAGHEELLATVPPWSGIVERLLA